jgi:hypothetical protein
VQKPLRKNSDLPLLGRARGPILGAGLTPVRPAADACVVGGVVSGCVAAIACHLHLQFEFMKTHFLASWPCGTVAGLRLEPVRLACADKLNHPCNKPKTVIAKQ